MKKKVAPKKAGRSLLDYALDKKRAACKFCSLPADVRAQLIEARNHKIRVPEQVEWLASEHGITMTRADFEAHHSGRHER